MTFSILRKDMVLYFHPSMILPGLGMIAVAVGGYLYWRKQMDSPHSLFWWGALAWVLSIALKGFAAAWTLPAFQSGCYSLLPPFVAKPLIWLYIGLLTGIFECGTIFLFLRLRYFRSLPWKDQVAFGIGYGGIEAFLLGLVSWGALLMLLVPEQMPGALAKDFSAFRGIDLKAAVEIATPIIERIFALFIHVVSCVWVGYSLCCVRWRWFWYAFAFKTAIDAIAGFGHDWGMEVAWHVWVIELIVIAFGVFAWVATKSLRNRFSPGTNDLEPMPLN